MPAKGTIRPDHIPVNKFQLFVAGLPPLTCITVGSLEQELEVVELPDRTKASGGNTKGVDFDVTTPAHHTVEQTAWEAWFRQGQDPVSPLYKKVGTLVQASLSGVTVKSWTLMGLFVTKRVTSELDMGNEGEQAEVTWSLSADDVLPA